MTDIMKNIKDQLDVDFDKSVETLLDIVGIPSVEGEAVENAPFGVEVAAALKKTAEIAENLGFVVTETDHYITVDLGDGTAADTIGILSHMDVVPLGEGWDFSPTGEVVGDKIYGRGTLDDKGPTVACLQALAKIRDNVELSRPVRMIIGGNEESGSRCMAKYVTENPAPACGFSPDGHFPVIFAEKGILLSAATKKVSSTEVVKIEAGTAVNAVAGKAVLEFANGEVMEFIGKSAHGSTPEVGENAIWQMLEFLCDGDMQNDGLVAYLAGVKALFCSDHNGIANGIFAEDEVSGKLTQNLGILKYDGEVCTFELDIRYPVTADFAAINANLQTVCREKHIVLDTKEHKAPLFVPQDHNLVETLLKIYQKDYPEAEPLAIGGGTYCRSFENFVAFGPLRDCDADTMHQANECITFEHFKYLQHIYAEAIFELAK